jgi:hypothetical protein
MKYDNKSIEDIKFFNKPEKFHFECDMIDDIETTSISSN